MAKKTINLGTGELTGDGESIRSAFSKVNDNFTELYDRDATDFDGSYNSLTNIPAIPADIGDLTDTGNLLSGGGFSGSYNDLTDTPTIPADVGDLTDTSNLFFDRSYNSLTDTPTIPADVGDLTDTGNLLSAGAADSLTSNDDINITINNDDSSTYVWNFGNTGDLTAPGDITTGLVNTGGRFIQDCADGITSIRWVNVDQGDPVQIIRVYSDDPKINSDTAFERAQIGINWSASQVQSGLTITSFDSTDPDSANQIEHTWQFQGDGALTFPDASVQSTAYTGYHTGDVTGSVFSDDSTLLIDGTEGKIVGPLEGNSFTGALNFDGSTWTNVPGTVVVNTVTNDSPFVNSGSLEFSYAVGDLGAGFNINFSTPLTETSNVRIGVLKIDDGVQEKFQIKANATGVVEHNLQNGQIIYHTSPDANFTLYLTNIDLNNSYATNVVLIIEQGSTGYYPNAILIDGAAPTIKWLGNVTPSPSANKIDVVTFTILNVLDLPGTPESTYTVLGSYSTYG